MKVVKNIIRSYVRREQLEHEIEQEAFDLVGPNGIVIGPQVWPCGVFPNSVIELVLWNAHADEVAHIAAQEQAIGNGRRQQEQDIQEREQGTQQREQNVQQREQNVQQREQNMQQREQGMRQREQSVQRREQSAQQGEDEVLIREQKGYVHKDLTRIREYQPYLSFLACKSRLGDYCT